MPKVCTKKLEDLISNTLSLTEAGQKGAITAFFYFKPEDMPDEPVIIRLVEENEIPPETLQTALGHIELKQRKEIAKDQSYLGTPVLHHLIIHYNCHAYINAVLDSFPPEERLELIQQTTGSNKYFNINPINLIWDETNFLNTDSYY